MKLLKNMVYLLEVEKIKGRIISHQSKVYLQVPIGQILDPKADVNDDQSYLLEC